MTISPRMIIATLVLTVALGALGQGTVQAQGLYPRNYTLTCTGAACTNSTCSSSGPVSLTGRLQLTSPTAGTGSVAVNANFGNLISPSVLNPFAVRILNGTANERSLSGNNIPIGCFAAFFTAPSFLNNTFGCYEDTEHDFDLTSQVKSAGTLSCHAKEM